MIFRRTLQETGKRHSNIYFCDDEALYVHDTASNFFHQISLERETESDEQIFRDTKLTKNYAQKGPQVEILALAYIRFCQIYGSARDYIRER